jgi:hypothetical protein
MKADRNVGAPGNTIIMKRKQALTIPERLFRNLVHHQTDAKKYIIVAMRTSDIQFMWVLT